ncbi:MULTISPECIES: hypothetical protein [Symbiopectobacterium]|uniref:hypothetical protein n=1 Tax=Symbiopectobacterium TaxID=801 RepID=UPI001A1C4FF2|nr:MULTISPECIES: hypothetical protein [Symbiopectobacterium]MBG6246765.1 hypothetical protein [Candidatus Symbiopectobacterium sp. PLON1]MBT9429975.1 hypothetical protein [Candidatus Symbiopectobacterium endolongispinus]
MASIKLTVNYLYQLQGNEKKPAHAVARVYVGDTLSATEEITGMTEEAVSKYLHHSLPEGQTVRVEWDSAISAAEVHMCPCCHAEE